MAKLIADSHYDIGGFRDVYEDRVGTRHLTTAGGLNLVLAAVADGVGGENKGELAAQTAIDALFSYLEKSRETEHAVLLTHAVQYANKAVFQLQRETRGASTTLSVAMLDENQRKLFIANVGDSRIYICRNQKLTQLTIDHSFANVMAWRGVISPDAVSTHPRANVLMRALGAKEQVEVDLGFYVGTTDYQEANSRGLEGLPLKDGDAILVCSDGLIKNSPKTHKPLVTTEEIVRTLHDKEGKKAAQELVSFALGRGPDDNISAAIIQMPDQWRGLRARRPLIYAGSAILGLAVVLGLVVNTLSQTTKEKSTLEMFGTATALQLTVVAGFTPTPTNTATVTPTPTPTLPPLEKNQVALIKSAGTPQALILGYPYSPGAEAGELYIYHDPQMVRSYLYAMPGSGLSIEDFPKNSNDDAVYQMRLDPDSQIFLSTGDYREVYLMLKDLDLNFTLQGCFAVQYIKNPVQVSANCYGGICSYCSKGRCDLVAPTSAPAGETQTGVTGGQIPEGFQRLFTADESGQMIPGEPQPISESEARQWFGLLEAGSQASNCANSLIPTPTPTTRPTAIPTVQPTKSGPGKPANTPTFTSKPPPSDTPRPPTNTSRPPTNTPRLPTNTPVPPTKTSKPTDTPVPPTHTNLPPTPTFTPRPPTPTDTPKSQKKTPTPTITDVPPKATPTPTNTTESGVGQLPPGLPSPHARRAVALPVKL